MGYRLDSQTVPSPDLTRCEPDARSLGENPDEVLLAAMLAHEINNLLTPVLGHAQVALRQSPDARSERALRAAVAGAEQATAIATALLETVVPSDPLLGTTLIDAVERARLLSPMPRGIELTVCSLSDVVVPGPVVTQVVINLLRNAERAIETEGGRGSIRIESEFIESCSTWNGPGVQICVRDTGPGLRCSTEPEDRAPDNGATSRNQSSRNQSSRSRSSNGGYGLGLEVCDRLLRSVGGQLTLRNRNDGPGAEVVVVLPCGDTRSSNIAA